MNENKELLLKYLCMALYYNVKCKIHYTFNNETTFGEDVDAEKDDTLTKIDVELKTACFDCYGDCLDIDEIKPYLRPMSSMTEEEFFEYNYIRYSKVKDRHNYKRIDVGKFHNVGIIPIEDYLVWLLKNHFDFMGLIPKGLAIEVKEGNNPYKN